MASCLVRVSPKARAWSVVCVTAPPPLPCDKKKSATTSTLWRIWTVRVCCAIIAVSCRFWLLFRVQYGNRLLLQYTGPFAASTHLTAKHGSTSNRLIAAFGIDLLVTTEQCQQSTCICDTQKARASPNATCYTLPCNANPICHTAHRHVSSPAGIRYISRASIVYSGSAYIP